MNESDSNKGSNVRRRVVAALAAIAMLTVTFGSPADAMSRRVTQIDVDIEFFYSTFAEDDNIVMLVGGSVEDFCLADPNNPSAIPPSTAKGLLIEGADGSVEVRVNNAWQQLHIYETGKLLAPDFVGSVCEAYAAGHPVPEALASGNAKVTVNDFVSPDGVVDVFNQARGRVTDAAGTQYYISGSADFQVIGGELQGNPADFVSFEMKRFP